MKTLLIILLLASVASVCHAQSSPDNTRVPPAQNISIFLAPNIWSLGAESQAFPGAFDVLLNGVGLGGALAREIAYCQGSIYVIGRAGGWFKFVGTFKTPTWQVVSSIPCQQPQQFYTVAWMAGAIQPGINEPTEFRIYLDGMMVVSVPYPATTGTVPAAPGCYEVGAMNKAGESRSSQVCK